MYTFSYIVYVLLVVKNLLDASIAETEYERYIMYSIRIYLCIAVGR